MHTGVSVMQEGTFEGQTNWHWAVQTLVQGIEFLLKCHVDDASFVVQASSQSTTHMDL